MERKISTSGLMWQDGGFTKFRYWFTELVVSGFIGSGFGLLVYAFISRNTFTYETLHILVLIGVGLFLAGIAGTLLAIFEMLFFIGADMLGLLKRDDDDVVV